MKEFFCISKTGHDKNRWYLIIEETQNEVFVSDGQHHLISEAKRKNKKHIQLTNKRWGDMKLTDENLRNAINDILNIKEN